MWILLYSMGLYVYFRILCLLYMQSMMAIVMLHHVAIGQLVTPILVCSLLHGSNSETDWTVVSFIEVAVSGEQFPINEPCDFGTCEPQFEATGVGK